MDKLVRDGKVAVLISRGFGAGWSTWNDEYPDMVFDAFIAGIVADAAELSMDDLSKIQTYCALKYPDAYMGGVADLAVEWVPEGELFRVEEYDGSESVLLARKANWLTA